MARWRAMVLTQPRELRAIAEQPEPPVSADESLLRNLFRQRGIAEPTPRHGKDAPFMAFNEFAVTIRIAATDGSHSRFILLRALRFDAGQFGLHDTPERHRRRKIVTCGVASLALALSLPDRK